MQPGMMQPGVFPAGMMPTGMHPGMLQAMQFAHLGPGGMPSGQMPQNPTNPLQGLSGVPSAQMEYLQRQMQSMGMQRPQGMGQQPYPGQQMHGKSQPHGAFVALPQKGFVAFHSFTTEASNFRLLLLRCCKNCRVFSSAC